MLPEVINEDQVHLFKFWFGDCVQDGINHGGELYYRLRSTTVENRARLYHSACRLSQQSKTSVIMTVSPTRCSLWVDLRNRDAALTLLQKRSPLVSEMGSVELNSGS